MPLFAQTMHLPNRTCRPQQTSASQLVQRSTLESCSIRRCRMTPKTQQPLHPYSVKIETPTGKSATLPVTLLTPKQAEEAQVEFKRLAHEAGIKGARINVQRVVADDYEKVISEAKACLRTAMPKAA